MKTKKSYERITFQAISVEWEGALLDGSIIVPSATVESMGQEVVDFESGTDFQQGWDE